MDAEDSDSQPEIGSESATLNFKEEKSVEEAIKQVIARTIENTTVQSHEDIMSQYAPSDRGRFQSTEPMRQTFKEQVFKLESRSIVKDFYRWSREFLELTDCLGI